MKRFDANALYQAMNKERLSRQMTWQDVSNEIGVSTSTIKRTEKGGRMEVDGMLAMVFWLGVPVESFVHECDY